jgi:spore germination cell wall hydrolase CwlJ-like protein
MSDIFRDLEIDELFALAIYGEARGEPIEGKIAVASVINNRKARGGWFGGNLREVILKPRQFSCFNPEDANRGRLEMIAKNFSDYLNSYGKLRECWWVACGFLNDMIRSNVKGATHYHSVWIDPPGWTHEMLEVARIGDHIFYEQQ